MDYVVIDFETASQSADSACALAMVRVTKSGIIDEFYSLIKPPSPVFNFSWLHGITWSMVAGAPDFGKLWPAIYAFIKNSAFMAAHNAPFDRRILRACCAAYNCTMPATSFLCTLKGARKGLYLPSYKLNSICEHLGIELFHHNALSDARAAARLLLHLQSMGIEDGQMEIK